MANTPIPAGNTIDFTVTISELVDSFADIFITLYGSSVSSSGKKVYQLNEVVEEGETAKNGVIIKTGDYQLTVKALGKHTALMRGNLMYEIKFINDQDDVDLEDIGSNIPIDTTLLIVDNKSKDLRK